VPRTRGALAAEPRYSYRSSSPIPLVADLLKATSTTPRRSSALSPGAPGVPRRWKASDKTASHVLQGGASRGACATAQWWWESRRRR
jgi:hypothetical protein